MQSSARIDELRQKFHENPRRYFAPLANEYRKAGDPEQAIAICRAHLAQQPGHMSGHVVYGQALFDARRTDEARGVFETALTLDPDNAIVLRHLGDIARLRGDAAEVRHWYARALDCDPHDTEVAAYLAELSEPPTEPPTEPLTELLTEPVSDALTEPVSDALTEPADALTEPNDAMTELTDALLPDVPPFADAAPEAHEDSARADIVVVSEPVPAEAEALEAEVPWRKTPPHEDSPFVTRTMAELYAKQGYHAAALDVYRQLALNHPDDREILARIDELTGQPAGEPPAAEDSAEADTVAAEFDENSSPARFTELGIPRGDSWDTDSWAAGFSADETLSGEFEAPDAMDYAPIPPASDVAAPAEAESAEDEGSDSHLVAYSPQAPDEEDVRRWAPRGPTIREFFATLGGRSSPTPSAASGSRPRGEVDAPKQYSDEWFQGTSPGDKRARVQDFPLASEAFARLFPDGGVSDEDMRAAFALSGALGMSAPFPSAPVDPSSIPSRPPPGASRTAAPPSAPEQPPTDESEEDIRRFREWLDGLAES